MSAQILALIYKWQAHNSHFNRHSEEPIHTKYFFFHVNSQPFSFFKDNHNVPYLRNTSKTITLCKSIINPFLCNHAVPLNTTIYAICFTQKFIRLVFHNKAHTLNYQWSSNTHQIYISKYWEIMSSGSF